MSQIIKPVMLDETGQTGVQKLDSINTNVFQLAEAIAAVHSVNGMIDDVVIDSTNIVLNKLNNSKTIAQVLSEEQTLVNTSIGDMQTIVDQAVARMLAAVIPVSFSTDVIEGDTYLLTISISEV